MRFKKKKETKAAFRVAAGALVVIGLAACQGASMVAYLKACTAKAITAFSFESPAATATIDEKARTVALTVPFGTDVTALVATFTTTGTNVTVGSTVQVSGRTPNNFSAPVIYLVTGADGFSARYTVAVTIAPSTAKAITSFSFVSVSATGAIDEDARTIATTVPYGTNVTALVATFTTTGSRVTIGSTVQVSGVTANNFSSARIYTVTAADGSIANYTVSVTVAVSSAKAITGYWFPGLSSGKIDENAKAIAVKVPYGTEVTELAAAFTATGSSVRVGSAVQISGVTANNFTSPVIYTVTAADGSTASYTVTVTVALSGAKAITSFSFPGVPATGTIDERTKTIAVAIPCRTNSAALVATFTTTGLSVTVGSMLQASGVTANDFRNPVTYVVTAADGSTASYCVSVTVGIWQTVGTAGFCQGVFDLALAVDRNCIPYVACEDYSSGKATVMKFAGGVWQTVGTPGFSADRAVFPCLAIDSTGTPFMAYKDDGNNQRATVMKFAGGSWQAAGKAGFSAGTALYLSLAIGPTDTAYIAYRDDGNGARATVMKYADGSWRTVGTAGFSECWPYLTSLAIDSTDTPYIAYMGFDYKATVQKFTGGSWQTVGAAGFSAGRADYISLAIDSAGTPYVAYEDWGNNYRATVMKYAGGSWQTVGAVGFCEVTDEISLVFDPANTPYVALGDTVMKYADGSWQMVGAARFSGVSASRTCMAIDAAGTLYFAFVDWLDGQKVTVMTLR